MTETIPLREGLFEDRGSGAVLLAGRCASCGHTEFPASVRCLSCGSRDQERAVLGPMGSLLCATEVHMGSGHFESGYTVGYVELQNGVRVFGQIAAVAGPPAPGTAMRIEIAPLWREGDVDVVAYRFREVGQEADHA